ncbi:MerC domain-containing protein [Limibacter armeniacum]|uniref:MerC domain-containing protein n=1 Tax=Limibacter armeniacum TaxID=466084 RepID=UPI002FE57204
MIASLHKKSDHIGIMSSAVCLLHCVATPFLFAVKSCSMHGCQQSPVWWVWTDVFFLVLSFMAVVKSVQTSPLKWVSTGLLFSWLILAFLVIQEYTLEIELPFYLIYVPALTLITLHFYNLQQCRCKAQCCQVESVNH